MKRSRNELILKRKPLGREVSRGGFTLIETITVFLAEMIVVGLVVGLLYLVFDARIKDQRADSARIAAVNLEGRFRDDVRSTSQIALEGNILRLTDPDGCRIVYSQHDTDLPGRSFLRRDQVRDDKTVGTESFVLPEQSTVWFSPGIGRNADRIALNIWVAPTAPNGKPLVAMPDQSKFDPFTREVAGLETIDLRHTLNWRTIIGTKQSTQK